MGSESEEGFKNIFEYLDLASSKIANQKIIKTKSM